MILVFHLLTVLNLLHIQKSRRIKVTYANFFATTGPWRVKTHRIRMVVQEDKLDYYDDTGSPTTHFLETKNLLNSVISDADKEVRFMSCDLKHFFLATPTAEAEYMRIHIQHIPPDIIKHYNVTPLFHNDYVYCNIKK